MAHGLHELDKDLKGFFIKTENPCLICVIRVPLRNHNPNRNNPPLKYRKIAPVLYSKSFALAALVATVT
jgi:hypothetical protein